MLFDRPLALWRLNQSLAMTYQSISSKPVAVNSNRPGRFDGLKPPKSSGG
jgi:hypothetical protein